MDHGNSVSFHLETSPQLNLTHRDNIVKEIVRTEESYVSSLQIAYYVRKRKFQHFSKQNI